MIELRLTLSDKTTQLSADQKLFPTHTQVVTLKHFKG